MKRWIAAILCSIFLMTGFSGMAVLAEDTPTIESLQIGDYIQLGQYRGFPILWRSITCDYEKFNRGGYPSRNNGRMLLYSDKILCFKAFDVMKEGEDALTNSWEESKLREWLNAEMNTYEFYDGEPGFLSDTNFTQGEKGVLCKVELQTFLSRAKASPASDSALFENCGTVFRYPVDDKSAILYSVKEFEFMDTGSAWGETQDRMFLLDEIQIYNIYTQYRSAAAEVVASLKNAYAKENYNYGFWLRTPFNGWCEPHIGDDADVCILCGEDAEAPYIKKQNSSLERYSFQERGDRYFYTQADIPQGVRPAFYLDTDNTIILSGTGSKVDPYVITGYPKICVFLNGNEVEFDQSPIARNETAYIPIRKMMEQLGAAVSWDEAAQKVTVQIDGRTIDLTVGMQEMYVDGVMHWLPAPVILKGDRTLVPLQVLTGGFGLPAEWDSIAQTITIITTE